MADETIAAGSFKPTWDSLRQFQCPDWFRDAKFGIWSHWGPQAVPMTGDWYARQIYIEGTTQNRYHVRKYGHPSKFGYKDIIPQWKAEKFDPDVLMDLYAAAGARYFVAQAAHHDNFHNWNSSLHRWNAVNMGPKKDILRLWQTAAGSRGLPFGFSEHMGATFSWYVPNKGADEFGPYAGVPYDGNDPAYADLYLPNHGAKDIRDGEWYTSNPWWHKKWYAYVKELIDQYQPDLLYSDGGVPFGSYGLNIIAHLYNTSAGLHGGTNQAVYTQKDRSVEVFTVGVLDIERSQQEEIFSYIWQTDTSVGDWFYNLLDVYKTPKQIVEMLVDITSKNGNLLLNIPQRPDGSLDDECLFVLQGLAAWIQVNGEGIYGTRPWKTAGEGPSRVVVEGFREEVVFWTEQDFRFTSKAGKVYAFIMQWPKLDENGQPSPLTISSLGLGSAERVTSLSLLGHPAPLKFEQTSQGLVVHLPAEKPSAYAQCLRVTLN
jgi:alpha-L-fucosidase